MSTALRRAGGRAAAVLIAAAAACSPAAAGDPPPPRGARAYAPDSGVPETVQRTELELLRAVEDRFKPVRIDLHRLPAGTDFEAVEQHYASELTGWSAGPRVEGRGAPRRIWTAGGRLVGAALVEAPPAGPASQQGPVLVLVRTDR